jgi:hypothetical protein
VQDIRLKAFEIASQRAIDESVFLSVAEDYFKENASQAKALKHPFMKGFRVPISLDTFEDEKFSDQWKKAIKAKNIRLALYALGKEKNPLAKAITLAQMGATSEAVTELDKLKDFRTQMIVLSHHFASLDQGRMKRESKNLIEALAGANPPKLEPWQALMVAVTAVSAGLEMTPELKQRLLLQAARTSHPGTREWINGVK